MSVTTNLKLTLLATDAPTAPYKGGSRVEISIDTRLGNGTSANQADQVHQSDRSVSASSNEDVDLRALTDVHGNTLSGLTEVVILALEADADNGDALHVKPSASNGWLGVLADASDIIKVQPGATLLLFCPADGKYPVGASTKSINVANQDSGAAAAYTLTVVARSA